jgi:hypothetical protein
VVLVTMRRAAPRWDARAGMSPACAGEIAPASPSIPRPRPSYAPRVAELALIVEPDQDQPSFACVYVDGTVAGRAYRSAVSSNIS